MIRVIGFEGGPCGGKTTAINYIANEAQNVGINTAIVPEVATQKIQELISNGTSYDQLRLNPEKHILFQSDLLKTIYKTIKKLKQIYAEVDTVILVDRVDNAAYISAEEYKQVCISLGYSLPPMYKEVDTLLYFPTVAKKSISLYKNLQSGNPSRYETPERAIETCDKNYESVKNHPNLWLINEDPFEKTLQNAARIALKGFGINQPKTMQ